MQYGLKLTEITVYTIIIDGVEISYCYYRYKAMYS